MKLIYLKIENLNNFYENKLELDFAPKKMVRKQSVPEEIDEVLPELFLGNTFALCGIVASGKTTVINIIKDMHVLLKSKKKLEDRYYYKDDMSVSLVYLHSDVLYNFKFKLKNLKISDFKCYSKKYYSTYYINDYLYEFEDLILEKYDNKFIDELFKLTDNEIDYKLLESVIKNCDYNISDIKFKNDNVSIKYSDNKISIKESMLKDRLTNSTYKIYELTKLFLKAKQSGDILFIDDIERDLNYELVNQLLTIIQSDDTTFPTVIFTTKNSNVLDLLTRNDCIYYIENKDKIKCSHLFNFIERNNVLKSKFLDKKQKEQQILD